MQQFYGNIFFKYAIIKISLSKGVLNMTRQSIGSAFTIIGMLLIIWALNKKNRNK